ncbi:hypothetical protein [Amphibacillus indicireducens]|uniref:Rpn family recombination-promoting nuclease/putative transposase n=1 Tax=Amphibacillus indicireducens TaxID=1076330 RepID=A0ABP7VJ94_9BACI
MAVMPTLIKENPLESSYTKHDQLYKELIDTFFEEFLEVFFPDIHNNLNFQQIRPLSEEVFTSMTDGEARRLDIVIEAKLKETDVVVIVHVEPQSYKQTNFNERMYHYFSMLHNKYRKPIIPIAVLSYDDDWEENQYTLAFPFFHVITFNYLTLHLRKKNWRDYIGSDNPVAAALLSEMGYTKKERVQVKKEFLRMIIRMNLNPAKQRLIYGFFESYLKLTEVEEEQLMREIDKLPEANKIFEIPISYEEKGKEIGKEIRTREIAIQMLEKNVDVDFIAEVTKLDIVEIEKLKQQL